MSLNRNEKAAVVADVTAQAAWTSGAPANAVVSESGVVAGVKEGSSDITATLFGAGALLCAGYCALLFALQRAGSRRVRAACLALCGALCFAELTANAFYEANQFEKYSAADFAAFTAQGTQMRVSRQELARLVGCSREMAGRVLKKLQADGQLHEVLSQEVSVRPAGG